MASAYLSQTFSTYDSTKIFTLSTWLKKSSNGVNNAIYGKDGATDSASQFYFDTSDQLRFFDNTSSTDCDVKTNRVFRDNSSFYHIVISVDTTQVTASNRVKIYVNGTQETSLATSTYPAQDSTLKSLDSAKDTFIGVSENTSGTKFGHFNGIFTHTHFIDGTAYDASAFGEVDSTTNIWKAKTAPSVTYGTNGFFLKFENSGSMGTDSSGNANNFTVNGTMTQTVDTPSNVFATWNVLEWTRGSEASFSNGNLSVQQTVGSDTHRRFLSTLGVSQGKWYWEVKSTSASTNIMNGITDGTGNYSNYIAELTNGVAYYGNGSIYKNNASILSVSAISNGDIVNIALDLDNNYIYFGLNGTYFNSGDPTSGSSGTGGFSVNSGVTYFAGMSMYINNQSSSANFGNGYFGTTAVASANADDNGIGAFEYAPPTGFLALCTKNINAQEYS